METPATEKSPVNPKYSNHSVTIIILMALIGLTIGMAIPVSDLKLQKMSNSILQEKDSNEIFINNNITNLVIDSIAKDSIEEQLANKQLAICKQQDFIDKRLAEANNKKYEKKCNESSNLLFFNHHPRFALWITAFAILIAFSLAFIPVIYKLINNVKVEFDEQQFKTFGYALLAFGFVLLAAIYAMGYEIIWIKRQNLLFSYGKALQYFDILLKNPQTTILILLTFASIGPLYAIKGLFIIARSTNYLSAIKNENFDEFRKKFKLLGDTINRLLLILAISISGTVVTTSFLRESILEALPNTLHYLFPIEFVYLYGLIYTIFLVIAYTPIYFKLKELGYQSLEKLIVIEDEDQKKIITDTLKMKTGSINTVQIILSLAAPALSGILSQFLG